MATGAARKGATRWRRRKDERPGEILAAALEVFAARGFAATRLEDVAARAGVSKGTLYLYFDSKEALLRAVVQAHILPNLAEAERVVHGFKGATPALIRALVENLGSLIVTTPISGIPKLIIAESGNFPELARFYATAVVRRGLRLMQTVIRRGIARGEFRPVDVTHAARLLFAPVLFAVIWKHTMHAHVSAPLDPVAFLRSHLDIFLRGLATDGGGGP